MSSLALFGGQPAVTIPEPHYVWPEIGEAQERAVLEQLRSREVSYFRRAGTVEKLEQRFAELVGLPYAISMHAGTAALLAGFFGLDLRPGDEVIAPAYTHLATVFPMLHLGLHPVLVDVDPETSNIDPAAIAAAVGPRTRAIAVTHQFGHSCDMAAILEIAKRHDLKVLEDCSHAHGARLDGRHVGCLGDVACFSLHEHKTVWGGEGGIMLTRHPEIAERAAMHGYFRQPHPFTSEAMLAYAETGYGLKSRIHPLAAALAMVSLDELDQVLEMRGRNYAYLCERVAEIPGLRPLPTAPGVDRGGHFRFILHYDREALHGLAPQRFLEAVHAEGAKAVWPGWAARVLNSYRMFTQPEDPFGLFDGGYARYSPDDFPHARAFSANTLQLPAFSQDARAVIDAYAVALAKVAAHAEELLV